MMCITNCLPHQTEENFRSTILDHLGVNLIAFLRKSIKFAAQNAYIKGFETNQSWDFESESAYTHFYTNKLPYVAMERLIMHA